MRPDPQQREAAFRLLCLNHSFLSYISALGAHREKITQPALLSLLDDAVCYVDDVLQVNIISEQQAQQILSDLSARISRLESEADSKGQLVLQQIGLLIALLPEIAQLKNSWRCRGASRGDLCPRSTCYKTSNVVLLSPLQAAPR